METRIGQQFGNFVLKRHIGEGGYAHVYLGEHIHLKGHFAAIKIFNLIKLAEKEESQYEIEAFRMEAQRLVQCIHTNIVRVWDFDIKDGVPFLVMEYAPQGSLRDYHPRGSRLSPEKIVHYVKQAASALQYLHDNKFIHRDVKPANMLLGQNNVLQLSDIGIAVVSHGENSFTPQIARGTPPYMAPEQWDRHALPASDQYSLGIVVYEWLCGFRPFTGPVETLEYQHKYVAPRSLRETLPELPNSIEEIVMTTLEKHPQQRFASVNDFAVALEQAYSLVSSQINDIPMAITLESRSEVMEEWPKQIDHRSVPNLNPISIGVLTNTEALGTAKLGKVSDQVDLPPTEAFFSGSASLPVTSSAQSQAFKENRGQPPVKKFGPDLGRNEERRRRQSKRRLPRLLAVSLVLLTFILLVGIAFASPSGQQLIAHILPVTISSSTTTITITPKSKDVVDSYVITAVTGTPNPASRQVQARIVSVTSASKSASANATGSIAGRRASGTLQFLNLSTSSITISGGTLTGADGVQVFFSGPLTVPLSVINVLGTAVNQGTAGNIASLDINGFCCGNSNIFVKNPSGFGGGQNPQPNSVITQNDISSATNTLIAQVKPEAQGLLKGQVLVNEDIVPNTLSCTPNVRANHAAGDVTPTVTVTGTATCSEEVYDRAAALALATTALRAEAVKNPGAGYAPVNNVIVAGVTQVTIIDVKHTVSLLVRAEGVWAYQFSDQLKQQLASAIANKSKSDAQAYLLATAGISEVAISISSGDTLPAASDITIIIKVIPGPPGSPTLTPSSPTAITTPISTPTPQNG